MAVAHAVHDEAAIAAPPRRAAAQVVLDAAPVALRDFAATAGDLAAALARTSFRLDTALQQQQAQQQQALGLVQPQPQTQRLPQQHIAIRRLQALGVRVIPEPPGRMGPPLRDPHPVVAAADAAVATAAVVTEPAARLPGLTQPRVPPGPTVAQPVSSSGTAAAAAAVVILQTQQPGTPPGTVTMTTTLAAVGAPGGTVAAAGPGAGAGGAPIEPLLEELLSTILGQAAAPAPASPGAAQQ